ncbi:MAG: NADH-quinone oxidoreductase subunit G [Proteobacteria bacterium]|nr:NADH-quinone oxidoreductase subunit G [Pseudomonadota bacterium]
MSAESKETVAKETVAEATVAHQDGDWVNIEIDGIPMQAPKGSMIIEATDKAGIEIPRFCYHPKLSIAANCRMCLVDVEKAPKPLPACATPVMEGMKVYTASRRAVDAQHNVMEFLLINHPLDCPICDQGGECELQDLAMGFGRSVSRFAERKRVVKDKYMGPLVQPEMTRCIHCTRCVRFLEEIAGTTEMGGSGRGDQLEIGTLVENSIDSELSGNIIDMCPVGALTDKPFRFAARAWELVAKPSVAAHDAVGSCLYHHVLRGEILRTVPRDNEATNETWLSDRDRFSHLGLYSSDRVLAPQVKEDGEWKTVSWDEAIKAAVSALQESMEQHGPGQLGMLMSSSAATEEYYLAQGLVRKLGSNNIDHRLREQDFSDDAASPASPAFERSIAGIERSDVVLLVGCNPTQEAPILGHRLRKAWRSGAAISVINPLDWTFTFDTSLDAVVAPQNMVAELVALAVAVEKSTGKTAPDSLRTVLDEARGNQSPASRGSELGSAECSALADRLKDAGKGLVFLGQFAMSHPDAAWLRMLAVYIAEATGSDMNVLPHGGNPVGAWLAGAVPHRAPGGRQAPGGMNAVQMFEDPRKCYLLWDFEVESDTGNPAQALQALRAAEKVIAICSFATNSTREVADIIMPVAPLPESEGSLVNLDGTTMKYAPAGKVSGEARPGWKILRRLGFELGLEGFNQVSLSELQAQMGEAIVPVDALNGDGSKANGDGSMEYPSHEKGLYRIGELAMYSIDALCRRSEALQQTAQADSRFVGLNPRDAIALGLTDGGKARVRQGGNEAELEVRFSDRVPEGGAWLRSGTGELGPAVAPIIVEVA